MIKLSDESYNFVQRIHFLSGFSLEDIKEIFEAILTQIVFDYMEEKSTHLPYLGELYIEHIDDIVMGGKKEAVIKITLSPEDIVKKIIGQIADKEETDIEKMFKRKIKNSLEKMLTE